MKKILLLTTLLSFFNSFSQSDKMLERGKKLTESVIAKPLCVVMDSEDEKYVNKLTKKNKEQELKNYKKLILEYNTYIKSAVAEHIKEFPSVKYITNDEYKKMNKKELKANVFLKRTFPMQTGNSLNGGFNTKPDFGGMGGGNQSTLTSFEGIPENIELDTTNVKEVSIVELLFWNEDEVVPYYTQNLNKLFCSKAEVYFAIRQLKSTLNNSLNKTTIKETTTKMQSALKTKTLIINKQSLEKDLSEAEIKKMYQNSFKIVEQAEYESLFTTKKEDMVLLIVIPYGYKGMFGVNHIFFDLLTNDTQLANNKKCFGKIKLEHFEYYTKTTE